MSVAVLGAAACSPVSGRDGGVDAGPCAACAADGCLEAADGSCVYPQSDAGNLCPQGCVVLMRDGGPVFYEDGGPYCLC